MFIKYPFLVHVDVVYNRDNRTVGGFVLGDVCLPRRRPAYDHHDFPLSRSDGVYTDRGSALFLERIKINRLC